MVFSPPSQDVRRTLFTTDRAMALYTCSLQISSARPFIKSPTLFLCSVMVSEKKVGRSITKSSSQEGASSTHP
jgi:hypothetical protein